MHASHISLFSYIINTTVLLALVVFSWLISYLVCFLLFFFKKKMENWSSSCVQEDDEFEKLVLRMNPPRVTGDNASNKQATLIKVDSANKKGSLLEVVQILTDMNLIIKRAYISSDGDWFMDVFHVTDQYGNKLSDDNIAERIQQSLGPRERSFHSLTRAVGVQAAAGCTTIELTGKDRPGLLSEVFAVLADFKCNVESAEVWTHNSRMASVVYITDEIDRLPIEDSLRLADIKRHLLYVLKGNRDKRGANSAVSVGSTHTERRLHQLMYADRDYDTNDTYFGSVCDSLKPHVTVEGCADKGYSVVNIRCPDRPKLIFDTVCTLTDMQYVVFHGTIIAEGPEALQEYYIRHIDGFPINSEAERQQVIHCLEAAIRRRTSEGISLELCCEDRGGLLSDVTRIFRENGLSVARAEITTKGSQAENVFYVTDPSRIPVKLETIEAVRNEIGRSILRVKNDVYASSTPQQTGKFSFGNIFRSSSEKFLYNLGLINSCS